MIWDKLSPFYDLFENVYNGKCNRGIVEEIKTLVNKDDIVLECACGTGLLTIPMAENCKKLMATDYSVGMLKQTKKKVGKFENVRLKKESITELSFKNDMFDVVVAANVIHLLDNPGDALNELKRVCKSGGKIIIPTYINKSKPEATLGAKIVAKMGVQFAREFDLESYKEFFIKYGFENAQYKVVDGRMPCAFAIIEN